MSKIGVCVKCGIEKKICSREMCHNCYRDETIPIAECVVCGRVRPLRSKMTCGSCAEKIRLETNPEKKIARSEYIKGYFSKPENKERERARNVIRYKDPEYRKQRKQSELKKRVNWYGLSVEEYKERCQNGCEICGSLIRLHMDHCHDTGKFRGILCGKCNQGLGLFDDNSNRLDIAIKYLNKFEK